jgi:ubiquinone/menaquinone biosynthesis C-methylase UbiE
MDARKRQTQAYFDEIGDKYGGLYEQGSQLAIYPSGPMREQKALRLLRHYKPAGEVLDAGCGTGHFACALASLGYQVRGLDISQQMIQQADATRHAAGIAPERAAFGVGDVEALDAESRSLDAVTSLGVIEYLSADDVALAEAKRVLKEDGVLVMAFRNRLFNLFSLNAYTQREIDAGGYSALLAEYQDEVAQCGNRWPAGDFARVLAEQSAVAANEAGKSDRAASPIPKPVPITLRQHTPREAREAGQRHGFQCRELLYFHFHPFPPAFEKAEEQVYNRLGLAMETLDQTPIGAAMASAFVAVFTQGR